MLHIIFGRENVKAPVILDPGLYFKQHSLEYDFKDPFVRSFISAIDKAEFISPKN